LMTLFPAATCCSSSIFLEETRTLMILRISSSEIPVPGAKMSAAMFLEIDA
jgi:hypothetical protein